MRCSWLWLGAAFCCSSCGDDANGAAIDAPADVDGPSDAVPVDAAPPDEMPADAAVPEGMLAVAMTTFVMGCNDGLDVDCQNDERPAHDVTLSPYFIDRLEVTQADYAECVAASECTAPRDTGECIDVFDPATRPSWPVTCVVWEQAAAYCAFVGKRLPTEAEWELAARGADRRTYPWGEATPTCELVNYDGASGCDGLLHDVGTHPLGASPIGALDMAGNAREWVGDLYASDYYATSPTLDPTGPAAGLDRVARGGNAGSTLASAVRAADRSLGGATAFEGLRCARSAL